MYNPYNHRCFSIPWKSLRLVTHKNIFGKIKKILYLKDLKVILTSNHRQSGAMIREAGCYTKGPGFESRIKHGCHIARPWPHQWLRGSAV